MKLTNSLERLAKMASTDSPDKMEMRFLIAALSF